MNGNITIKVFDNSGISQVLVSINHTDFGSQNRTMQFNGTHYWYTYSPLYDNNCREVTFYMNNTLNRWNSSSYLINNVLFSPPKASHFQYAATETRATSNITIEVADNTGVSQVLLAINHSDFGNQNQTMSFNGTHWWYPYTPTTSEERTVTFFMNDTLNNWNLSSNLIQNIFYSPPQYSRLAYFSTMAVGIVNNIILYDLVDNTYLETVNISINNLDNESMLPLTANRYKYPFIPDSLGMDQFLTIYVIDELGNNIFINVSFNVIIDDTPPLSLQLTAPNVVQNQLLTISINATDNTGIKELHLFIAGTDFPFSDSVPMVYMGGDLYEYSFIPTIAGNRTFSIILEDIAGNMAYIVDYFDVAKAESGGGANPLLESLLNYLLVPVLSAGIALAIMFLFYHRRIKRLEVAVDSQAKILQTLVKKPAKSEAK
jgi:hypothetical protein